MITNIEGKVITGLLTSSRSEVEACIETVDISWFASYFLEAEYIWKHHSKYGKPPSLEVFQDKFPSFRKDDGDEPLRFYVKELKSERLFVLSKNVLSPIISKLSSGESDGFALAEEIAYAAKALDIEDSALIATDWASDRSRGQRYALKRRDDGVYMTPPFGSLRSAIYRFVPENLITIFARPGTGKTWLSCFFAVEAAKQGLKTVLYSPEMSKNEILDRIDGVVFGLPWSKFTRGMLDLRDMLKYKEGIRRVEGLRGRLKIIDEEVHGMSLHQLGAYLSSLNADVFVLDAAHQMGVEKQSFVEAAYTNCRAMKQELCKKRGLLVFQTVQEKRAGNAPKNATRASDNVSWSDAYLQESDVLLNLRGDPATNQRTIGVEKARNGRLCSFNINFQINPVSFSESFSNHPSIELDDENG